MATKVEIDSSYSENDFFGSSKSPSTSLKQGVIEPRTAETSSKQKYRADKNVIHSRDHRRIDTARTKVSLLARKHILTKSCLVDVEHSLTEISNSINSLQKLDRMLSGECRKKGTVSASSESPDEDHMTLLDKLIAESTESVNQLQMEIEKYQNKNADVRCFVVTLPPHSLFIGNTGN